MYATSMRIVVVDLLVSHFTKGSYRNVAYLTLQANEAKIHFLFCIHYVCILTVVTVELGSECLTAFSTTFQLCRGGQYPTCRKSLTNFIT